MLSQDELDKLLEQENHEGNEDGTVQAETGSPEDDGGPVSQEELDKLLEGDDSADSNDVDWGDAFQEAAEGGDPAAAKALNEGSVEEELKAQTHNTTPTADFDEFKREKPVPGTNPNLDFLLDVPLEISVELGRSSLRIKELLQLGQGSVVELNKMAGEPADIYVNGKLLAKGEVVVINEKFGIKLSEIISPEDRVKNLG